MNEGYPSGQRIILNANKGVSNVIGYDVIHSDLQATTDRLFNVLKDHYGPFCGFAAIDDGDPMKETEFTKDGIGIVRAIEFAAPQEDWVRKTIAYIGSRMESSVGDGTTSAMMFSCAMLKHMSATLKDIRPITYYKLRGVFDNLTKEISKLLKESAYKVDPKNPDAKVVRQLVYNQVYTSSHGDKELANALAEVYANTPPEVWDYMTYSKRSYESDERFVVLKTEGQYSISQVEIMANAMNNQDMGTWFQRDNCKLLVLNDPVRTSSPFYPYIEQCCNEATAEKPLVILCHSRFDTDSYQSLTELVTKCIREDKPIAIFTKDVKEPATPQINDFVSLQLLADKDITKVKSDEAVEFNGVWVKYRNKVLSFDNLYKVPEQYKDELQRHHVVDKQHIQYTDYLEGVKRIADSFEKLEQTPDVRRKVIFLRRMYAKLRYTKIATIEIGGHAYDNIALQTVLDDSMRAASKALTTGVVFGNNRSLYHSLRILKTSMTLKRTDDRDANLMRWLIAAMEASLEDMAMCVYDRIYKDADGFTVYTEESFMNWWFNNSVNLVEFDPTLPLETQGVPLLSETIMESNPIVQPVNTDISMLERFAEVAIKYVLTERIIVRGAAYVDNKKDDTK